MCTVLTDVLLLWGGSGGLVELKRRPVSGTGTVEPSLLVCTILAGWGVTRKVGRGERKVMQKR